MNRDPFYSAIVHKLSEVSDGQLFEQCVCDLLGPQWGTLVPVPGGGDAGMDGAWQDPEGPGFIVATTADKKGVVGNIKKNLLSHKKSFGGGARVLVASSKDLSATLCRRIKSVVDEMGFRLANWPYTQQAIAELLYHKPRWCKELLGLSGRASALGKVPRGTRPFRDLPLIGREEDLQWLCSTSRDRVLVGQPGMGKTYLARQMVNQGEALFVIDSDPDRLADAIRDQQPTAVIVENAHLAREDLETLRLLQEETSADFEIVAECWPGGMDMVRTVLLVPELQCRTLEPLTPSQIVELIKAAGIGGPDELMHQLVRQAMGCPGRAAMLAHLCLSKGVEEVWDGRALKIWVSDTFSRLINKRAIQLLAAFSLGGNAGMGLDEVARVLQYSSGDIREDMAQLALGGIVRDLGHDTLEVLPEPLRCVLVADYFFDSPVRLPLDRFWAAAQHKGAAALTLIGAYARAAKVSSEELLKYVEEGGDRKAWEYFVLSDPAHSELVLDRHPDKFQSLRKPILKGAPARALPLLLKQATGDTSARSTDPAHPLRIIGEWVLAGQPGSGEPLTRRRELLSHALRWLAEGNDEGIGLECVKLSMSPAFEEVRPVPGDADTFTLRRGMIAYDELRELAKQWKTVREYIQANRISNWVPIIDLITDWAYPQRWLRGTGNRMSRFVKSRARIMIRDTAQAAHDRPGVLTSLAHIAGSLDVALAIAVDAAFAALYPKRDYSEGWEERDRQQLAQVEALANKWAQKAPGVMAAELSRSQSEAKAAGVRHSWWPECACRCVAEQVSLQRPWIEALVDHDLGPEYVGPFLRKAAETQEPGWLEALAKCLQRGTLRVMVGEILMRTPSTTEALFEQAIDAVNDAPAVVESVCRSRQITDEQIEWLLRHSDDSIAQAAAIGLWEGLRDAKLSGTLKEPWRRAVVAYVDDEHHLVEILQKDHHLAYEWLLDRAERDPGGYRDEARAIAQACTVLKRAQKLTVLRNLANIYGAKLIVRNLVRNDPSLYRELLRDKERDFVHLEPLRGSPDDSWADLACQALDAGYTPSDLVSVAHSQPRVFHGGISRQYEGQCSDWERLLGHPDPRIQTIAKMGLKSSEGQLRYWRKREAEDKIREYYS